MPFTGTGTGISNANDVFFSGPSKGHTLKYNETTAKWNNVATNDITVLDYGAACNGVTDDTAKITAMLTDLGYAKIPANKSCMITQIILDKDQCLLMEPGSVLTRPATSGVTGAMVRFMGNYAQLIGVGATIEALNECPNGIISFRRKETYYPPPPDPPVSYTCEWCRLVGVRIRGGEGNIATVTPGSRGIVFSGSATFQNRVSDVTISNVETAVLMTESGNMNQVSNISAYHITGTMFSLDGTVDSCIGPATIASSQGATVIHLYNGAQFNAFFGIVAEPYGPSSVFRVIGASCTDNSISGIANVADLGTDAGTNTIEWITRNTKSNAVSTKNGGMLGFYGAAPITQQTLSASPTTAEIATALKNLGLVS